MNLPYEPNLMNPIWKPDTTHTEPRYPPSGVQIPVSESDYRWRVFARSRALRPVYIIPSNGLRSRTPTYDHFRCIWKHIHVILGSSFRLPQNPGCSWQPPAHNEVGLSAARDFSSHSRRRCRNLRPSFALPSVSPTVSCGFKASETLTATASERSHWPALQWQCVTPAARRQRDWQRNNLRVPADHKSKLEPRR